MSHCKPTPLSLFLVAGLLGWRSAGSALAGATPADSSRTMLRPKLLPTTPEWGSDAWAGRTEPRSNAGRTPVDPERLEEIRAQHGGAKALGITGLVAAGSLGTVGVVWAAVNIVKAGLSNAFGSAFAGMDSDNGDGTYSRSTPEQVQPSYSGPGYFLGAAVICAGFGVVGTIQTIRCNRQLQKLNEHAEVPDIQFVPYYDPLRQTKGFVASLAF